jgi:hypothetical protein
MRHASDDLFIAGALELKKLAGSYAASPESRSEFVVCYFFGWLAMIWSLILLYVAWGRMPRVTSWFLAV